MTGGRDDAQMERASGAAVAPPEASLRRSEVLRLAWPIILANAAVPLLGIVDTAAIGNTGAVADLGAIALGSLVFTFVYWSFGFLRMGTTGFTAQAAGAGDELEVRAACARAVLLGVLLGAVLVAMQWPIGELAFGLLDGTDDVESIARRYFRARIWGAPAALGTFAVMGTFIGLGQSRLLLVSQLFLNGMNILLDVTLVVGLGLGVRGIAAGTAVAEWLTLCLSLGLAVRHLRARGAVAPAFLDMGRVLDPTRLARMLRANTDIMIRTLLLVFGFAWFTDRSARLGDVVLAANHILLQFLSFSAFFLDGFAHVGESLIGSAVGARSLPRFDHAVRRTSELAAATAVLLSLVLLLAGPLFVRGLTTDQAVRAAALGELPLGALYVLLSVAAYQLDGVFIGATQTRDMLWASVVSICAYLCAWWVVGRSGESRGLWIAFVCYVIARAVALGLRYPALRRAVGASEGALPGRAGG